MPEIDLQKDKLPFLFSGNGTLSLQLGVIPPDVPLTPTDADLASLQFGAAGNTSFVFGTANQLKVSVNANSSASLIGLWQQSTSARLAVLSAYDVTDANGKKRPGSLSDFLPAHPDSQLLVLQLGASAGGDLAATFPYSVLSASATLSVGGNVGYTYIRPSLITDKAVDVFTDFITNIRMPGDGVQAPLSGEVVAYEYGGQLTVGAGLSAGYELKGTPGFNLGDLKLSENYDLSIIGKLGLSASLNGQFSVQVSAAYDAQGALIPGWARVLIKRKRSSDISATLNATLSATNQIQGLPDSGKDFLGALLGVNVKNWLNVLQQIHDLSDFNAIQTQLDGLAKKFIEEWTGKAFDQIPAALTDFLGKVQKVVDSYQNLDNSAISLFDQYFGKLDLLASKLNDLLKLASFDQLPSEITDSDAWNILRQLTGGDPLSWILGQITVKGSDGQPVTIPSLPELKKRVQQTLDLLQSTAHDEIRKVITLAKQSFPLDSFLMQLSAVDSVAKLKAIVNQKLGDFVERLTGKILSSISSNSDFNNLVKTIQTVTGKIIDFENTVLDKLKSYLNQSFQASLSAGYDRATEASALIDVAINLNVPAGVVLFKAATQGDFSKVLSAYQPDLVRLNQGELTHQLAVQTSFEVNVVGWHIGLHYQGVDKVVTNTDQQIVAEDGGLTVYTTTELKVERDRERNGDRLNMNLVLRFIGESHGALQFDKANQQYLIDLITSFTGSYGMKFDLKDASTAQLRNLLQFAPAFNLVPAAQTVDTLTNRLTRFLQAKAAGTFGPVTLDYEVRYTELGLERFFVTPFDTATENFVRGTVRKVVLANYLQDPGLENVGRAYFSNATFQQFENEGPAEFTNHPQGLTFNIDPSPFPLSPNNGPSVDIRSEQLSTIKTLYLIENSLVSGLAKLEQLILARTAIKPQDFENALSGLGEAFDDLEGFSNGVNTVFAVFDQLILRQVPAKEARAASLEVTFQIDGQQRVLPLLLS